MPSSDSATELRESRVCFFVSDLPARRASQVSVENEEAHEILLPNHQLSRFLRTTHPA
jgi:hypothetical protein